MIEDSYFLADIKKNKKFVKAKILDIQSNFLGKYKDLLAMINKFTTVKESKSVGLFHYLDYPKNSATVQ